MWEGGGRVPRGAAAKQADHHEHPRGHVYAVSAAYTRTQHSRLPAWSNFPVTGPFRGGHKASNTTLNIRQLHPPTSHTSPPYRLRTATGRTAT